MTDDKPTCWDLSEEQRGFGGNSYWSTLAARESGAINLPANPA